MQGISAHQGLEGSRDLFGEDAGMAVARSRGGRRRNRTRAWRLERLRPATSARRKLVPWGFHSRHQHDSRWTTETTATAALKVVATARWGSEIQKEIFIEENREEEGEDGGGEEKG